MARRSAAERATQDAQRFGVAFSAEEDAQMRNDGPEPAPEPNPEPPQPAEAPAPAPEPQPQPAPESGKQPDGKKPDGEKAPQVVPLPVLLEERNKHKDTVEALTKKYEDRLTQIVSRLTPQPATQVQPEPVAAREIPDADKDALGAIKMTAEEVKLLSDFKKRVEAQETAAAQEREIAGAASLMEIEFRKTTPDYDIAAQALLRARVGELVATGRNPVQAAQIARQDMLGLAAQALREGRNPAEIVYSLARGRGYVPQPTPQQHEETQRYAAEQEKAFKAVTQDYDQAAQFLTESRSNEYRDLGHTDQEVTQMIARDVEMIKRQAFQQKKNPAEIVYNIAKRRGYQPKTSNQSNGAEQIDRLRRGQEAGRSLGQAGGSAPAKTGIEALLAMSDGDFARALDKMSPAEKRRNFGD